PSETWLKLSRRYASIDYPVAKHRPGEAVPDLVRDRRRVETDRGIVAFRVQLRPSSPRKSDLICTWQAHEKHEYAGGTTPPRMDASIPGFATALLIGGLLGLPSAALAKEKGTVNPKPLPPLAHPDDPKNPAKELFARRTQPTKMEARSLGFYTHGCLSGG